MDLAWNPMNTDAVSERIKGAATARRVGTDALSPIFAQVAADGLPNAELVDGELAMRAARRIKTDEEVAALRRIASGGRIRARCRGVRVAAGITEQALAGALLEASAAGGVCTPSNQDVAWVTSREHPWRRANGDGRVQDGDLVAFSAGVLADGYVGEVRTNLARQTKKHGAAALQRAGKTCGPSCSHACQPGCRGRGTDRRLPRGRRTGATDAGRAWAGHGF